MARISLGWSIGLAALAWSALAAAEAPRDPILTQQLPEKLDPFYRTCSDRTASGLGFTMLRESSGRRFKPGEVMVVDYVLYLAEDGTVVDHYANAPMMPEGMMPGAAEGLPLAAQGSVIRLCIPARLGFGPRGAGPIPPDADLVLQADVRLIMTRDETMEWTRQQQH